MDSELRDLRERVEMLERALSSRHPASGRFCRPDAPFLRGFGALVALAVVAVIFDLPITVRGAGPTDQGYFSAMNTAGAEAGTLSVDIALPAPRIELRTGKALEPPPAGKGVIQASATLQ